MENLLTGDFTTVAIGAALEAGEQLKRGFGTQFGISSKEGSQNLVTDYDYLSQELILKRIRKYFPSHQFLAEEGAFESVNHAEPLWIVDPLDGTVNFARSIPIFAISIAVSISKEIVTGIVYQPLSNELFVAQKGRGAFLNGKQLRISATSKLEEAFIATGFPYNVTSDPLHCIESFDHMARKGVSLRRLGAAAIDLAYVAAGRFDGFWEVGLHPWDMAAGKLLVEEAGGRVSSYGGSPHQIFGYFPLIATNGYLHNQLVDTLKETIA